MISVGIDPGSTHSSLVVYHGDTKEILAFTHCENESIKDWLDINCEGSHYRFGIEIVMAYGKTVGHDVFRTAEWCGCIAQTCSRYGQVYRVKRRNVVSHLTGGIKQKSTDAAVRCELIEMFGKPGKKSNPGKLYGIKGDQWSALAIAVVTHDLHEALDKFSYIR